MATQREDDDVAMVPYSPTPSGSGVSNRSIFQFGNSSYEPSGIGQGQWSKRHAEEAVPRRGHRASLSPDSTTRKKKCQLHGCSRDVFFDTEKGGMLDFCSRRHADIAVWRGERSRDDTGNSVSCKLQGCMRPVYCDPVTRQKAEYCSNGHVLLGTARLAGECARDGCAKTAWVDQKSGRAFDYCGGRCARRMGAVAPLVGKGQCSLPGCNNQETAHPYSQEETGYCCRDHRLRATKRSLGPNPEQFVDRTFRGGTTNATDFQLSVLTKRHPDYLSVKEHFDNNWQKPKPSGGVSVWRIFKIQVPEDIQKKNKDYQDTKTNVSRLFHGTPCSSGCKFFVDLRGGPCGKTACNVCSICTHGFKLADNLGQTARRTNFNLRYGQGLYFSSVSGKANDYAAASEKNCKGRALRCMFMANVAIGKAYETYEPSLDPAKKQCPPPGYDSVLGR